MYQKFLEKLAVDKILIMEVLVFIIQVVLHHIK